LAADHLPPADVAGQPQVRVGAPYMSLWLIARWDVPSDTDLDATLTASLVDDHGVMLSVPMGLCPACAAYPSFSPKEDLKSWGMKTWFFEGCDEGVCEQVATLPTDFRAHSMLGLAASRRDAKRIDIHGSLRAYHTVEERYVWWTNRTVAVQRWSSSGWLTLKTVHTDAHGNLDTSVSIPWRVGLRLATPDTPEIWGASSRPAVL